MIINRIIESQDCTPQELLFNIVIQSYKSQTTQKQSGEAVNCDVCWFANTTAQFGVCWASIRLNKFSSDSCYKNWQQISNPQKWIIYIFLYVTLHYILSRCISSQADIISHNMMWHDDRHQKCFLLFWVFLRFYTYYPKYFRVISRKMEGIRWVPCLRVCLAAAAPSLPSIV